MDNHTYISVHLSKLNDQIGDLIEDDPELVTDPTNLDALNDKVSQIIFSNHEFPMSHYSVDVEPYGSGGYRINIGLKQ